MGIRVGSSLGIDTRCGTEARVRIAPGPAERLRGTPTEHGEAEPSNDHAESCRGVGQGHGVSSEAAEQGVDSSNRSDLRSTKRHAAGHASCG
ncbi:hypothetical protein BN12_780015 [Nostocoides japonicum T1-X7]|uniref:Uncharacterized protein n=1 Tax=Nostocoides japonicum T1-X7 TaxID=1194083 RepID=A0A077M356_9MICO|nr:hypothetical protein BN12_780015 [Tetrasphaera japonica T1-X7]